MSDFFCWIRDYQVAMVISERDIEPSLQGETAHERGSEGGKQRETGCRKSVTGSNQGLTKYVWTA